MKHINGHLPLISADTSQVIQLLDPILLLALIAPSIALYAAGVVDRMSYGRVLRELRKEEAEEALEEREEVGVL